MGTGVDEVVDTHQAQAFMLFGTTLSTMSPIVANTFNPVQRPSTTWDELGSLIANLSIHKVQRHPFA